MRVLFLTVFSFAILSYSCENSSVQEKTTVSGKEISAKNTLIGEKNFLTDYKPINSEGLINVVVEIPAGTIDKWEVNKTTGNMNWEIRNGKPRKVKYLGYPGNYGMIPQTVLSKALGGDGDPLDVLVLGPTIERGAVISVKLIGVLKLLDSGEQDDKLIAVMQNTHFSEINNLKELEKNFTGSISIIETFFQNYKGAGKMEILGFEDEKEANKILNAAIETYKNQSLK